MADHSAVFRDADIMRLKSEVFNEYENMISLKKSIGEISLILKTSDNERLLNLALQDGEISLTTYFSDIIIMFQIEDRLLELEREYYKSLARLYDHELLSLE